MSKDEKLIKLIHNECNINAFSTRPFKDDKAARAAIIKDFADLLSAFSLDEDPTPDAMQLVITLIKFLYDRC